MMTTFWNARYAEEDYAYGTEPNVFLKQELDLLAPGMILFPAEGQGRNAVYAAMQGWNVHAFDNSVEGRRKALQWAEQNGVSIQYALAGYEEYEAAPGIFDCIALIYAHPPAEQRRTFHQKLIRWLKPGGVVILEGFSTQQLGRASGGPQNLEMLFSREELLHDFAGLGQVDIREEEVLLHEGKYHSGMAAVIRLTGRKGRQTQAE